MTFHSVLVIGGIALIVAFRICYAALFTSVTYKFVPKKWRLWMLGLPRHSEPPKSSDIVM
jgi:hypothetical protein